MIKLDLFSEQKTEQPVDNTQPKEERGGKSAKQVDPEDVARRKSTIIKWVVGIILLALVCVLVYFSCFYQSAKSIDVNQENGISLTDNKLVITDSNGQEYKVDENNVNMKMYSYIEFSSSGGSQYQIYVKADNDTICFGAWATYSDSERGRVFIVGGQSFHPEGSDDDVTIWGFFNYATTARCSVQEQSPWLSFILNILPTLVLIIVMVWIMNRAMKMQGGGSGDEGSIFGIGKSQAKLAQSTYKFSDVAGIEEEKNELIEIVDYLKKPDKYAAMGARTPRGVILYGPPGTGKTLLAKAVAGEAMVPFFQVSGSAFEDMLVGVGAKRVRDLFSRAKKAAPSIIFIDELDSVASKRGKYDIAGGSGGLADQTINQLLAEMDGFSTKTGVVVMAATNRLDVLDDAILRPGRFDRHIQVNLPDIKEREAILKIHARNKNISSKISFNDIARRTPGFSGAQLENVLNEATLLAVRFNKTIIGMEEIDEAIDRVIAGPAKKSRVITEEEKKQIAYHEAGHALVGLHTPGADVVEKITIIPRGRAAGYTLSTPEKQELNIQRKSDLLGIVASILGGRASEEVIYGKEKISTGAANDLYRVSNIVRSMVMQLGMSDAGMTQYVPSEGQVNPYASKLYSEQTAQILDKEIEKIINQQYAVAKKIIEKNKTELDLIVESLMLLETIVKSQIDYIHKNMKLPQEALDVKNSRAKSSTTKERATKK